MKVFWKSALSALLAAVLVLPAFAGCSEKPDAELPAKEAPVQLIVLPSEEEDDNRVLKMSTSQELDTQANEPNTARVVAETTPAGLPVDWSLSWDRSIHGAPPAAVLAYVDFTLINPKEAGSADEWSNEIELKAYQRIDHPIILTVMLRGTEITDTRTVIAQPLPEPVVIEEDFTFNLAYGDGQYENTFEVFGETEIVLTIINPLVSVMLNLCEGQCYVEPAISHTVTITLYDCAMRITKISEVTNNSFNFSDESSQGVARVRIKYVPEFPSETTLHISIRITEVP